MSDHPAAFDRAVPRKEAAKLLGVCIRTMRNLELRGELQPIYITTKNIGYRDSALRRFLFERTGARRELDANVAARQ